MTTHRFIVEHIDAALVAPGGEAGTTGEDRPTITIADPRQVRQLTRVLRVKQGDRLELADGAGTVCRVEVWQVGREAVVTRVVSVSKLEERRGPRLTVALGVLKGERFDWALEKLTEVGADAIRPFFSARTVVKLDKGGRGAQKGGARRRTGKHERWQAIVMEATEQSERARIPQLAEPIEIGEILTETPDDNRQGWQLRLICSERSSAPHLAHLLEEQNRYHCHHEHPLEHISIIIGPEGGFSDDEKLLAKRSGWLEVSLGSQILRAETAAIVAASTVLSVGEILWRE